MKIFSIGQQVYTWEIEWLAWGKLKAIHIHEVEIYQRKLVEHLEEPRRNNVSYLVRYKDGTIKPRHSIFSTIQEAQDSAMMRVNMESVTYSLYI